MMEMKYDRQLNCKTSEKMFCFVFLQKQSYIHLLPDLYFPSGLLAAEQQLRPPQNVAQRFGEL